MNMRRGTIKEAAIGVGITQDPQGLLTLHTPGWRRNRARQL